MIELHGWVTIRETYKVTIKEDKEDIIIDNIKREIKNLSWFKPQTKKSVLKRYYYFLRKMQRYATNNGLKSGQPGNWKFIFASLGKKDWIKQILILIK